MPIIFTYLGWLPYSVNGALAVHRMFVILTINNHRDVVAGVHHRAVYAVVGQDQESGMVQEVQLCVILTWPEI